MAFLVLHKTPLVLHITPLVLQKTLAALFLILVVLKDSCNFEHDFCIVLKNCPEALHMDSAALHKPQAILLLHGPK
jgi:hypothetical protein